MEVTEGVTEHLRCSVHTRGVSGYSATFLQACRKRSDEGDSRGGQSRMAGGTDNLFMGSSRRTGATTMYRSHEATDRLGGFGEDVFTKARGEWTEGF